MTDREITDRGKESLYEDPWHQGRPYDSEESVRLAKACRVIQADRQRLGVAGRYRLVDVGCGVGPLRTWLDGKDFHIIGLEISEKAAALARGNYDECLVCDAEHDWPLKPGSADGVHAGAVMEHVVDWHAPLNQANRVLRDGGLLVVSVPNLRYWKEIKRLIRGRQPHWMSEMTHIHAYTPRFLRELVALHGFEVSGVQADRVNLPLLPKSADWVCRTFAGIGSVIILAAHLARRVRVEDRSRAAQFPNHKDVALRSIEVPID